MKSIRTALAAGVLLIVGGCLLDAPDPTVDANSMTHNDLPVHDPSVIRAGDGSYYAFGSHLAAARSTVFMNWQFVANGVDANNPLWSTIPAEGTAWTGAPGSWAADVIKFNNGKYHFYYSFCGLPPNGECTGPRSYLGVATSDHIEGPYVNDGIFLRSGMSAAEFAGRLRAGRHYELRPDPSPEHHRPGCFLRQARQVVDDIRLILGRHLHSANG